MMDSEETLVEPAQSATIFFSRDDMGQTDLFTSGRHGPSYRITSDRSFTRTFIFRTSEAVPLAILEQRGILPDRITFGGQEARRLKSWLNFSGSALLYVSLLCCLVRAAERLR